MLDESITKKLQHIDNFFNITNNNNELCFFLHIACYTDLNENNKIFSQLLLLSLLFFDECASHYCFTTRMMCFLTLVLRASIQFSQKQDWNFLILTNYGNWWNFNFFENFWCLYHIIEELKILTGSKYRDGKIMKLKTIN